MNPFLYDLRFIIIIIIMSSPAENDVNKSEDVESVVTPPEQSQGVLKKPVKSSVSTLRTMGVITGIVVVTVVFLVFVLECHGRSCSCHVVPYFDVI